MDDYIKRTDVNRVVAGNRDYCTNEHWYTGAGLVTTIYNELQSIPPSDVVEVRHGEWVCTTRAPKSHDGYYFWNKPLETVFVCSECGRVERVEEPYCNCGAKMDGKGESDD